jgi:hypothetical protein
MTQSQSPNSSRDSVDTAAGSAKELKDEARDTAQSLKDRAVDEAQTRGDEAKAGVADEISDMGNALRRAAEELRSGSPQERTFGHMADALADMSETVRDKDLGEIAGDVSDFARRNPLAFLGGAALLGFAGTRLARASERNRGNSVDLAHMWDSDEHDDEIESELLGRPATPAAGTAPSAGSSSAVGSAATTPAAPAHINRGDK